jgi:hypothetical protein
MNNATQAEQTTAGKIFISYRRDDDPSAAGRVSDGLASRFGQANLFIDVDNLLAGQRFDVELAKALAACDVLIAVIGQRWMDLLKTKNTSGDRDYVREEIAAALQRQIVVIPVRVGREGQLPLLPRAEDLPADIRDLILYQKSDVTHERFGRDIGELIEAIAVVQWSKRPTRVLPLGRWGWLATTAASVVIVFALAYFTGVPMQWSRSPAIVLGPNATPIATADNNRSEQVAKVKAEAETNRLADAAAQARREQEDRQRKEAAAKAKVEEESQLGSSLLDKLTLQAITENSLERRGFKRGLLETRGFAKGRADRPICMVNSNVGTCKLEAFFGGNTRTTSSAIRVIRLTKQWCIVAV